MAGWCLVYCIVEDEMSWVANGTRKSSVACLDILERFLLRVISENLRVNQISRTAFD